VPRLPQRVARRVTAGAVAALTATSLYAAAATPATAAAPAGTPATATAATAALPATPGAAGKPRLGVIVTMAQDTTTTATAALAARLSAAGGTIGTALPIVHGFTVSVPRSLLPALAGQPGVRSVTPDASGHLESVDPTLGYDPATDEGSLSWIEQLLGAQSVWSAGYTGAGVDVALIDSGVAPIPGLTSGNVINGPDLSFESQHADVRHLDTFGHGTHMASIIAGRDAADTGAGYAASAKYNGIAPDARLISVKVAASDGSADVSQVIAAIDWVTQNAHAHGLNIRVLNLSYGTDGTQSYLLDPLSYAVEQAWKHGIVVVVAAGNDGTTRKQLADPAIDPYVIAVGADDPNGTLSTADDVVPAFAQRGTTTRRVDLIAPGVHVLGLRDPNSFVDQNNPGGRVGSRFIRGSGTSQATAVVSGVAALVVQKYPLATPDQVKYLLRGSATALPAAPDLWEGLGVLNAAAAVNDIQPALAPTQAYPPAGGTGTLEGARGSSHVALDDVTLTGEQDIFGQAWAGTASTSEGLGQPAWTSAGEFNGTIWTGDSWDGDSWDGDSWDGDSDWSAVTWSGLDWTGSSWSSRTWVSRTWVDNSWDGRTWVGAAWTSRTWVSRTWVNSSWADATWS
jgi:serine protease AprX